MAGHQAGQFLFLPAHGESHPFTIASNWNPENQEINLIIKDLGDYTHRLPQRLNIGHTVQIDGAYGRFNFSDKNEQIWVSNGIGFTPFLARLKELAKQPSNQPIDWFHTDRNLSAEIIDQWKDLAQQANVTFHYIPFFIGAGSGLLMGMYFNLFFLLTIPFIILIMRQMAKRDDMIFRFLGLRLKFRLKARNREEFPDTWCFSPNEYRNNPPKQ